MGTRMVLARSGGTMGNIGILGNFPTISITAMAPSTRPTTILTKECSSKANSWADCIHLIPY